MNPDHPGNNPYDFIINHGNQQSSKFSLSTIGGDGNKGFMIKIGLIVGVAVILMIAIAVVSSLLGGQKDDSQSLIKLAQTQQAIILSSTDGSRNTRSQAKANSAITTNLSLMTQQSEYLAYLATQDITIKAKQLALGQSAETTASLKAAVESSSYDTTYGQIMQKQLEGYAIEIQTLYGKVSGPKLKAILTKEYEQTQLLIKQLNAKDVVEDNTPTS